MIEFNVSKMCPEKIQKWGSVGGVPSTLVFPFFSREDSLRIFLVLTMVLQKIVCRTSFCMVIAQVPVSKQSGPNGAKRGQTGLSGNGTVVGGRPSLGRRVTLLGIIVDHPMQLSPSASFVC